MKHRWPWVFALIAGSAFGAPSTEGMESPRSNLIEVKVGPYRPLMSQEAALNGKDPYSATFGGKAMLLAELEFDHELYQGFGTASVGVSAGYGEKFANATAVDANGQPTTTGDRTGFFVVPLQLLAVYRWDYAALHWGVPLAPYVKAGLVYMPWWSTKGGKSYSVDGATSAGAKWGYDGVVGLSFLLDALDPHLARDFDTDMGVNHTYVFGEFTYAKVDNFGGPGLVLSSRHFLFGLAFEF